MNKTYMTMKKIKICLAVPCKISDAKVWSGTHHTLYNLLGKREDVDLTYLEYDYTNEPLFKNFYAKIKKFIFTWSSPQDFFVRNIAKKSLAKALASNAGSVDAYLFPACACCLPNDKKLKNRVAVYTDSLMYDLNQYRPYRPLKILSSLYYRNKIKADCSAARWIFTQNKWSRNRFEEITQNVGTEVSEVKFGVNLKFYEGDKDYSQHKILIVLRKGAEHTKGLPLLLKAFRVVRSRIPDAELHVVGTDYGKDMEGVFCYYNQPRETTVRLFKESTIYVMPARREPNGITYLEALANKTPTIALDRFSFPEFCGHGEYGFICQREDSKELADLICEAFSNPDKLKLMGEKGQQFVRDNYSWEKTVDSIVEQIKADVL